MFEKPQMAHNESFIIAFVSIIIGILNLKEKLNSVKRSFDRSLFYFVLARCTPILFFELKATHEFLSDYQRL
ncbi:hypothetical protein [Staphylococcus delphini]|uniref:hypothetical protein n=1 Tax=Staphylococcus delphini TaxID=53344 RepID=UPI0012D2ADF9|nr:hypothetical protein [Staphylococcus delphini]MTV19267.1 hypothetical protein [Staphylococcus delphini]